MEVAVCILACAVLWNALIGGESGDRKRGGHDALWLLALPLGGLALLGVLVVLDALGLPPEG